MCPRFQSFLCSSLPIRIVGSAGPCCPVTVEAKRTNVHATHWACTCALAGASIPPSFTSEPRTAPVDGCGAWSLSEWYGKLHRPYTEGDAAGRPSCGLARPNSARRGEPDLEVPFESRLCVGDQNFLLECPGPETVREKPHATKTPAARPLGRCSSRADVFGTIMFQLLRAAWRWPGPGHVLLTGLVFSARLRCCLSHDADVAVTLAALNAPRFP